MGGAGLGLAIAQWIAQQHHGTITVQSAPGQGSEFSVELPTVAAVEPHSR
jgi:signal transduction histidine kinase